MSNTLKFNMLFNKNIKTGIITSKETKKTRKMLALLDFTFDIIYSDSSEIEELIHSLFDENEIIDIRLVE